MTTVYKMIGNFFFIKYDQFSIFKEIKRDCFQYSSKNEKIIIPNKKRKLLVIPSDEEDSIGLESVGLLNPDSG